MRIDIPSPIRSAERLGHVHFIGIGGAGLSAIARLMNQMGLTVSGSDRSESPVLAALRQEGITCFADHRAENIVGVDTVIASTAVTADNPEILAAQRAGVRLWPRSAGLQAVMADRSVIAVAGTHGKTTTTAMLASAVRHAGVDASFAIGAEVASLGTNARWGSADLFLAEADESDGAFLVYTPKGAVVTNVDADHLDYYDTTENYDRAFGEFIDHVGEFVVLCSDDPVALSFERRARERGLEVVLAGFNERATLRGHDLVVSGSTTKFSVTHGDILLGTVSLQVPGRHYATDALLALGAGLSYGLSFEGLTAGLAEHQGARRRMEFLGEAAGVHVYDSYAHHPSEIRGDLEAARAIAGDRRLVVAFQPHLVTRTRLHGARMGAELSAADQVVVADIYLAREVADPQVTSQIVLEAIDGPPASAGGSVDGLDAVLFGLVGPGDLLLTLGAGDIASVGPKVLSRLTDDGTGDGTGDE